MKIALDDFGTGYSSLSYLRNFPFDTIKIDRCFIRPLAAQDQNSLAIIRAVTQMGSSLGIDTTAEGIETKAQLEIVQAEGCTSAQGYYLHRPMSASAIEKLLAAPTLLEDWIPARQLIGGEAERLQALEGTRG